MKTKLKSLLIGVGLLAATVKSMFNHPWNPPRLKFIHKLAPAFIMLLATVINTQADTTNSTSELDFVPTLGSWLTTIDYSKYWPTNEIDFSVGGLWANNVNWANYINAQKNIGSLALDGQMDNAGVAGTIERISAGGGYRLLNRGDLSIHALVNGGYNRTLSTGFVEPNLLVRKLMAHGAFMEISLNYDFQMRGRQPDFPGLRAGGGWTF